MPVEPTYLRSQCYRKRRASFVLEPCSVVWDMGLGASHLYPIDEGRVLENKDQEMKGPPPAALLEEAAIGL